MRAETIDERLFFSTGLVMAKGTDSDWVGTGFAYAVPTKAGDAHLLVTNKHVLEGATDLTVRFLRREDDHPVLGSGTQMTIMDFKDSVWLGHPDPAVDVAVVQLSTVINEMEKNGAPAFVASVGPNLMLTREEEADLDAIEEVTFVGYPNGIYDTANLLPIARRGTTATPIAVDYQGRPAFLIDAAVYPGSSGSPVFLFDKGVIRDRGGNVTIGVRIICLGVLAAVHVAQVEGEVVDLPARKIAKIDQPLNLGIVYKAEAIDLCVDLLLARAGLSRVGTLSQPGVSPSSADELLKEAAGE